MRVAARENEGTASMREVMLEASEEKLPTNNFLIYGDSRSGKTTFLASFPRVLILADASEKGWESLIDINDEWLFEPGVKPMVWAIESMADMTLARAKAEPLIRSGRVLTLGIDSITFYADMYLAGLLGAQTKPDTRKAYGDLGTHLRDLRVKTHGMGCNSVWLALAKHPEEDHPSGGPLIPGAQGDKLAAATDFIFYARLDQVNKNVPAVHELRTKKYMSYIAGNRLGARSHLLPDPFTGRYEDFLMHLGYDVARLRASLKPIGKAAVAVSAPIKTVTPPVIRTVPVVK